MRAKMKNVILFALLFVMPSSAYPGEIKVTHSNFDHFNVSMPEPVIAGEDVTVKLQAVDNLNNNILSFGEPKKFVVSVTGSASVTPSSFDSSSFIDGSFSVVFNDKTAENGTLSITESGNPIPIFSKEFSVLPGKLDSLTVKGPGIVIAGERFELKIIEKDSFGNIVPEPISANNLNVSFKGNIEPKADMLSMSGFKNGVGIINFVAEKTGTVIIEIKDMATGRSGTSEKINVLNGPVHSFKTLQPKEVIAGEPFDFSVIPVDRFGNVVLNYASTGGGVAIASSGKLKPFPSTIPAYAFVNGQAKVELRYDAAETVSMSVSEIGNKQTGTSDRIVFAPPVPEKFEIVTPDTAIAGQKFKVKIIVYNQLSHVFKDYNVIGAEVLLSTTGTGVLVPNRIPPSAFVDGVAIVDLQYNKSESFEIRAAVEKTAPEPGAEKPAEKAAPAPRVEKAAEKADPAPKPVEKTVSAPRTDKPAIMSVPKTKAAITPEKPKAVPQTVPAVSEQKDKKAGNRKAKKVYEIEKVSIDELANRATAAIHIKNIDADLVYKVDTENMDGGKWIALKVRSAVNKVEGTPKLVSSVVENVVIEEDKKDAATVVVKMKLLTPPYYNVWVGGDSINITILKP